MTIHVCRPRVGLLHVNATAGYQVMDLLNTFSVWLLHSVWRFCVGSKLVFSQQDETWAECWFNAGRPASVVDSFPALNQHWINVSWLGASSL